MKKSAQRMCAFLLAAAMMIPLTGCKKGNGKGKKGSSGPRQEYVKEDDPYYSNKETELKVEIPAKSDKEIEYQELYNAQIIGDQLMCEFYVSYKMPKEVEEKLNSFDYESGDYTEIEKIYSEYYGNGMVIFDMDGNVTKVIESDGSEGFTKVIPKNGGGFYATRYKLLDGDECKAQVELVTVDENFEVKESVPLDENVQDVDKIIELDNGNFLFVGYSENYIVGKDGKMIKSSTPENWINNYFKIDGKVYGCFDEYNETTYESKLFIQQIDENTAEFTGDKTEVSFDVWNAVQGEDGIYCSTEEGVTKVDLLKNEEETILEWNWTDVNYMDNYGENSISVISEDKILLTRMVYEETSTYGKTMPTTKLFMNVLTREDKNPHAGKRILQIGTLGYVTPAFYDQVITYNLAPEHDARIQMRFFNDDIDYGDDYMKSVGELSDTIYLEMLSGDGPDILMNFSSLCQFNTDDVLVDLNTFVDGEKGFNRADYFDNILNAFETSEKLYHIPVCINIDGYVGNKDLIGERTGWTYEEFDQIASSIPQNVSMTDEMEYMDFLQTLLLVSAPYYVDYGTKDVKFDSPEFKKALEISKKYGVEHLTGSDVMNHLEMWSDSMMPSEDEADPFKEGLQALRRTYIYGIRNYVTEYQALKNKTVFVGIPSPNGTGMTAAPSLTFAISAASKCKDEAWDFIRFFFEEDQQTQFSLDQYSIPLNRKALDAKIDDDIKYYEEEREFFEELRKEDPEYAKNFPDEYFYEITPEMKADFIKLVESVSVSENTDPAIMAIINEDAAPYFAGQKSVDDVAKLIQNRAKTKISER